MAYWLGFLIFLSGILTYMMYPRNDAYQQEVYQEQSSIMSFVVQHQTARDYLYQMGVWSDGTANPMEIDSTLLMNMLPEGLGGEDTHGDDKVYTSIVVCLTPNGNDPYILNDTCAAGDHRFVVTYDGGSAPIWWKDKSVNRYTWVKSIVQRTHGSKACGVLERANGAYTIFNGQTRFGYEREKTSVPEALAERLAVDEGWMFCMSRADSPYAGTPSFVWDKLHDNRTAGSDPKIPTPLPSGNSYSLAGVVDTAGSGSRSLLTSSGTFSITENNGQITAGSTTVTIEAGRPFSFMYTSTGDKEILSVYYYDTTEGDWVRKQDIKDSIGPTLTGLNIVNLSAFRMYSTVVSEHLGNKNARVDRKRFGLDRH